MGKLKTGCVAALGVFSVCGITAQASEDVARVPALARAYEVVKVAEGASDPEAAAAEVVVDTVERPTPQEIVAVIANDAGVPNLQAELDTIGEALSIPESAVDMEFIMDLASDLGIDQDMLDLFAGSVSPEDKESIEHLTSQFTEDEINKIKGVADQVTENLTPEQSEQLNTRLQNISLKELTSIRNAILSVGDNEMNAIREILNDLDVSNISSITDILDGAPSLVAPLVPLSIEEGELIDGSLVDDVRDSVSDTVSSGTTVVLDAADTVRDTVNDAVVSGTDAVRDVAESIIGTLAETFALDLTAMTEEFLTENNLLKAITSGNAFTESLAEQLEALGDADTELLSFGTNLFETSDVVVEDLESILESLRSVSMLNLDVQSLGESVRRFTSRLYTTGDGDSGAMEEEGNSFFSAADLFSDFSISNVIPTEFAEKIIEELPTAEGIAQIIQDPTLLRDAVTTGRVDMPKLSEMIDSYVSSTGIDIADKITPLGDEVVETISKDPIALKAAIDTGRVDMSFISQLLGDTVNSASVFDVVEAVTNVSPVDAVGDAVGVVAGVSPVDAVGEAVDKVKQGAEEFFDYEGVEPVKEEEAVKEEEEVKQEESSTTVFGNRKIRGNRRNRIEE